MSGGAWDRVSIIYILHDGVIATVVLYHTTITLYLEYVNINMPYYVD